MSKDQLEWYRVIRETIDVLVTDAVQEIADREIRQDVDGLLVAARNILNREIKNAKKQRKNG